MKGLEPILPNPTQRGITLASIKRNSRIVLAQTARVSLDDHAVLNALDQITGKKRLGQQREPKWFHPFPARMPLAVASHLIRSLTKKTAVIADRMVSLGTTLVAARQPTIDGPASSFFSNRPASTPHSQVRPLPLHSTERQPAPTGHRPAICGGEVEDEDDMGFSFDQCCAVAFTMEVIIGESSCTIHFRRT